MISGRGALISGMRVPSTDSEEIEPDDEEDLESGVQPPDSDYASYAPPNIFPTTDSDKRGSRSKAASTQKDNAMMEHTDQPVAADYDVGLTQLDSLEEKRRRPTLWYALACFSLLLIGAVVAVGVTVAGNNKNDLSPRQQELSDYVASISDPAALADSARPQAKAYHWLVFDDDLWVNESDVVTKEMAVQRYVLATFYFATSGPNSWIENTWLQGHECSWTGIQCNTADQVRALVLGKYLHS
jgi:hypothetical protein